MIGSTWGESGKKLDLCLMDKWLKSLELYGDRASTRTRDLLLRRPFQPLLSISTYFKNYSYLPDSTTENGVFHFQLFLVTHGINATYLGRIWETKTQYCADQNQPPFSLTNKKTKQHDSNIKPIGGESNGKDNPIRNYELQKIQSTNGPGKTLMV